MRHGHRHGLAGRALHVQQLPSHRSGWHHHQCLHLRYTSGDSVRCHKLRIVTIRFGAEGQKLVLERWINPNRSRYLRVVRVAFGYGRTNGE